MERPIDPETVIFGEVGLGGEVRAVVAANARVAEARQLGFKRVFMPANNREQVKVVEGIQVIQVATVEALIEALFY